MSFYSSYDSKNQIYFQNFKELKSVRFSVREIDVAACILHNRGEKKIAEIMGIMPKTVNTHIYNLMQKLHCNARDHIIDFFEKSGKLHYLREYYFHLVILSSFERALRKIGLVINSTKVTCLINYSNTIDIELKLLEKLAQHLKLGNIIFTDNSKNNNSTQGVLIIGENSNINDKTFLGKDIILLLNKNINISVYKDSSYIDFRSDSDYYFSTFKLIEKITDKDGLKQVIQEFKNEYEAILCSWQGSETLSIDLKQNIILNAGEKIKQTIICVSIILILFIISLIIYKKKRPQLGLSPSLSIQKVVEPRVDKETGDKFKIVSPFVMNRSIISNTFNYEKKNIFLKKENIFEQLDKILINNQYAIIIGVPGVGKSSYASEYVRELVNKNNKLITRAVIASSNTNIYNEYLKIAQEYEEPNLSNLTKEVVIQKVHNYLANIGEVIFVFDNVENYNDITEYTKNMPMNVKLIITSRNNVLSDNLSNKYQVKLEAFNQTESINYLKQVLSNRIKAGQISEINLKELVEEIGGKSGCIAYKLVRAAAWLKDQQLSSVDDYIRKHSSGEENGIESALLFDLLKEFPVAWKIMQYSSYLDPDFISMQLLSKLLMKNKDILNKNIIKLQSLSLVEFVRKPDDNGIKLHRLTQEIIPKYIARNQNNRIIHISEEKILLSLIKALDELMPIVSTNPDKTWIIINSLYSSTLKVVKLLKSKENINKLLNSNENYITASLYNKLGMYYQNIAYNYEQALKYHKKAEEIYSKLGDKFKKAESLVFKGGNYFAMRKLEASLENFEQAISILDKDNLNVIKADALIGKGIIYDKKNIDSLKFYKEAYEIYKKLYLDDHPKLATALHNIGWYYRENQKNKNLKEALKYFEESLAMRMRIYSNQNHPDIADSLNSIGTVYTEFGGKDNLEKALNYQNQVLQMRINIFQGQINQGIINSYFRLGQTCKELKDYFKSLDFFVKARIATYDIHNTYNYGPIIGSFKKVAEVYEELGNEVEAIEYYKKGYSIVKRYKHDINENKILLSKMQSLAPEFIDSSEIRLFITTFGGLNEETYNIKVKLQKIFKNLYNDVKETPWNTSWFNNRSNTHISDYQIKKILKSNNLKSVTEKELEIAKSLYFEAINLGIMSRSEWERKFHSMLNFANENPQLILKIANEHPEYFIDGTLMIKCADAGIIPFELALKAIGKKEYEEWLKITK